MNKIIYLDAAATAQKSVAMRNAQNAFLCDGVANSGRGICGLSANVDAAVAAARERVADFICARANQIVFTFGTTDAMNRIANIVAGRIGVVAVSDLDHHGARLPFEAAASRRGGAVVVMPLDDDFNLDSARVPHADVAVITAMSNVLGVSQDVGGIIRALREKNPDVITIVDAAQYVAHDPIDVNAWDCDFLCFSGHKIGADTGLGIMYIKNPGRFVPDKFGGGMVARISDAGDVIAQPAPDCFEAGTLPLTQIVGLTPAIDAWQSWDGGAPVRRYIYDALCQMPGVRLLTARDAAMISFVASDMHPLDFGARAGARGLCVRVGNCCASWIMRALGTDGCVRISNGPWNTMDDAACAVRIIKDILK